MAKLDGEDFLHVESITSANSVDDVVNPAAGGSYIEAVSGDEMAKAYIEALTFEEFFNARPEYIKRIQNEMKTVRQDDAIKAAKAEADSKLTALNEAQEQIKTLEADRDAAVSELAMARRDLALEKVLRGAGLPALYENDLRTRLASVNEAEWLGIIDIEKKKATKSGAIGRVMVEGAGQQIHVDPVISQPRKPSNVLDMTKINSPEQLAKVLSQLGGSIT